MNYITTAEAILAVNIVLHGVKLAVPAIQGRWTQLAGFVLSVAAGFITVPVSNPGLLIGSIAIILTGAIGFDQLTKREV